MKIAIFEIGDYHDTPDITRVFSSVATAIENIPRGFSRMKYPGYHYNDKISKKWLTIEEYEVEP